VIKELASGGSELASGISAVQSKWGKWGELNGEAGKDYVAMLAVESVKQQAAKETAELLALETGKRQADLELSNRLAVEISLRKAAEGVQEKAEANLKEKEIECVSAWEEVSKLKGRIVDLSSELGVQFAHEERASFHEMMSERRIQESSILSSL